MNDSDLKQAGISKSNFYLPEPKRPTRDPYAWLLVGTSFAVALGFCLFAVLAYAFEELHNIPFRTELVVYGAWALAIGGELSTPVCVFEIYRKLGTDDHSWWDWVALFASGLATLVVLLLATASLLNIDANWPELVKVYGPVLLMFAAALDGYAGFMECGLYLRRYDRRYHDWEEKYREWSKWAAYQVGWADGDGVYSGDTAPQYTELSPPPEVDDALPLPKPEQVEEDLPGYIEKLPDGYYKATCPAGDFSKMYGTLTGAKIAMKQHWRHQGCMKRENGDF